MEEDGPKIREEVAKFSAEVVHQWIMSGDKKPLMILPVSVGAGAKIVCVFPLVRYSKGEFARALGYKTVSTLNKVLDRFCVTPASDGRFDAETVEMVRRLLRHEEGRMTPYELRKLWGLHFSAPLPGIF